jgi:DNA repair exonuclease SbcCD ATPase subunit
VIQLEDICIHEVRGIRDLRLTLGSKSYVIVGPNGSGKSGVIDAIDFLITGNISRLTGVGSGGLTLLKHGPHVHRRDDPGDAWVSATVRDPVTGKTAVLRRNIKTANRYSLDPDTPEMRTAVEQAQQHPELTLSRREIIKYIVAEAGKRSQEVQALLKLDRLGEIRAVLRTAQTKTSGAHKAAQEQVQAAENSLRPHLDLSSLLEKEVIFVLNKHRAILELPSLLTLTADTDLAQGIDANSRQDAFNKAFETGLTSVDGVLGQHQRLKTNPLNIDESTSGELAALKTVIENKLDQTAASAARSFLIVAQERWMCLSVLRVQLSRRRQLRTLLPK